VNVVENGDEAVGGVETSKDTVQDVLMQEYEESEEDNFVGVFWQHDFYLQKYLFLKRKDPNTLAL
jgi:hypothetical protein